VLCPVPVSHRQSEMAFRMRHRRVNPDVLANMAALISSQYPESPKLVLEYSLLAVASSLKSGQKFKMFQAFRILF